MTPVAQRLLEQVLALPAAEREALVRALGSSVDATPSPTREAMAGLVEDHVALDEPMTGAIWIHQTDRAAWLIEIVPSMTLVDEVERPVAFQPTLSFRHPLNLIVGSLDDLVGAVARDVVLARAVVGGEVLRPGPDVERLIAAAADAVERDA